MLDDFYVVFKREEPVYLARKFKRYIKLNLRVIRRDQVFQSLRKTLRFLTWIRKHNVPFSRFFGGWWVLDPVVLWSISYEFLNFTSNHIIGVVVFLEDEF